MQRRYSLTSACVSSASKTLSPIAEQGERRGKARSVTFEKAKEDRLVDLGRKGALTARKTGSLSNLDLCNAESG
jgi:hypothetical protein